MHNDYIPAYMQEYIGKKWWANVFMTPTFIKVVTYSCCGLSSQDPLFKPILLSGVTSDTVLGQAVLQALNQSRVLSLAESNAIHSMWEKDFPAHIQAIMKQFGYKSKRAFHRYMDKCSIERHKGKITIDPQIHEQLDIFTGQEAEAHIVLPDTASPAEIGAGLRLAFRRCKTKRGKVFIDHPNIPLAEYQQQWVPEARVFETRNGLEIATYSRYGLSVKDSTVAPLTFPSATSDEVLGQALQQALAHSRFLEYEAAAALLVKAPQAQKDWVAARQAQWGYPTKRGLLAKMRCCFVTRSGNQILLKPSHHEKLETWNEASLPDVQTVVVSAHATTAELGAGLRLALSRCTSKVRMIKEPSNSYSASPHSKQREEKPNKLKLDPRRLWKIIKESFSLRRKK
jgi:CDI immunity protein